MKKRKNKSILSLGGIAKGRKVGTGNERDYTKKIVAEKVMKEGLTKQHKEFYKLADKEPFKGVRKEM
jgi:hypothetical protein